MRFSPIVLLLFAMLGCGSESPPANEVDRKAREQDVETIVENKSSPATSAAKPVETQEQAIAAIKKLGGKVTIGRKSPNKLIHVDLRGTKVTDAGLVHLKELTNLHTLYLINTKVTDEGVKKLQTALPNCNISHY